LSILPESVTDSMIFYFRMEETCSNDFTFFAEPVLYPLKSAHLETVLEVDEVESSTDSTEYTTTRSTLHQTLESARTRSIVDVEREPNGLVRRYVFYLERNISVMGYQFLLDRFCIIFYIY
jgi:hypothetical protein